MQAHSTPAIAADAIRTPAVSCKILALCLPAEPERPGLTVTNTHRVPVLRWLITGAEAFPASELRSLLQDRVGLKLTLDELNAAAARITAYYRKHLFSLRASTAGSGMTYGRAAWQTPIGGDGLYVGIAWSDLRYELGENFESLDAHGDAQVGTLWTAYPFMRTQTHNFTARLSYDNKRLNDRIDAAASNSSKSLDLISGRLDLDTQAAAIDQGAGGRDTEGTYQKLALSVSRLQRLERQLLLYAALSGQATTKNLDSSEKQSVGGAYGVRAYPQGEATGDHAAILNRELRWEVPGFPEVQALVFADAAAVWANHSTLSTDRKNRRVLSGEGIGAQWHKKDSFAAKAYVGWRSGPQPTSDKDRRPRFWLQLAQYF